jgi:anaerobic selenocysteine-containing dehydrogenase
MIKTACPLDCYDACAITCDPERVDSLVATPSHPVGNGALCIHMNRNFPRSRKLSSARVGGREVELEEALDAAAEAIGDGKTLLYRGSGNLGVMQSVSNLLIERVGGTLTHGSLCDGAGQAGIEAGRGVHRQLPLSQIAKADVIVVWGRNLTVTNSHIMPFIEGKKVVVIDPVRTPIARKAHLHIQLKPRSDFYLAIMLARFIIMEDAQNDEWLERMGLDIEDFYDFTRSFRIKAILEYMGLSLDDMGDLLNYLQSGRVVFLVGNGVQKYSIGHYVLWAIDSLAATLGLFGEEGCGVSYLGMSRLGFDDPFAVKVPTVSAVDTPFHDFDTVLVQGANPAESMPDTARVLESLSKVRKLIYFGLYENATSRLADIVIPAATFLEKNDLRLSYGHHIVTPMPAIADSAGGISEYDFCNAILTRLGKERLESEESYLNRWLKQCRREGEYYHLPSHEEIPYRDGFGEDGDEEFEFIDDFDDDFEDIRRFRKAGRVKSEEDREDFYLVTPKASHSLNTQFAKSSYVHLPPSAGFVEKERVRVFSDYGSSEFEVRVDDSLRDDTVLIYAGSEGVNFLTPSIVSQEGGNACYQEVKVRLERVE